MKKNILFIICFTFAASLWGEPEPEKVDFNNLSEALGHLIVRQLQQPGLSFNLERIVQGMLDEQAGKPSPLTEEEYEQAIYAHQEQQFLKASEKNLSEAEKFLKENGTHAAVKQVEPRLQFQIVQEGNGEEVMADSTPLIHYTGKLLDGTIFATSQTNNQPVALPLKQSIPGFAKGLTGMKEGEKRILYMHPELAYGLSGNLPPNSLLIFEVEIIKANSDLDHAMLDSEKITEPEA